MLNVYIVFLLVLLSATSLVLAVYLFFLKKRYNHNVKRMTISADEIITLKKEFRSLEEKYHIIADFMVNSEYWLGPDRKFWFISPACLRMTGYHPGDDKKIIFDHIFEQGERYDPGRKALRESEQEIVRLNRHIMNLQEKERQRVARDLHDGVGQLLLAAKLNISLFQEDPEKYYEGLDKGLSFLDKGLCELREVYSNLYPSILNDLGLDSTIQWYVKNSLETNGISVQLQVNLGRSISSEVQINLYRIIQEIFSNILKHSQADSVSVILDDKNNEIIMSVEDNGIGFDMANIMGEHPGYGLSNMRHRTKCLGGLFTIDSSPGKGTRVNIHIKEHGGNGKDQNFHS